jgi:hypothetical protein
LQSSVFDSWKEFKMSTATLETRLRPEPLFGDSVARGVRSGGRRLTLEQRISSVWEGLLATGAADCPICRGPLDRHAHEVRCGNCGATLS